MSLICKLPYLEGLRNLNDLVHLKEVLKYIRVVVTLKGTLKTPKSTVQRHVDAEGLIDAPRGSRSRVLKVDDQKMLKEVWNLF
ncbi:12263_t:CDS:2 [Entrophospora sp. SA101]|nr:12263_t:CDS:2 [Entrophospora sp. SA101]